MPLALYDAHNHLAAPELQIQAEAIEHRLHALGMRACVVNGTSPSDWQSVIEFAQPRPWVLPAIGLHPWKVNEAPANWRKPFAEVFKQAQAKVVGEIGLDQWIEGHDIARQQEAFCWQLDFAATRNLPVSIHCLRAIGPLMETLRTAKLPDRGFHIHAYNGPLELIPELLSLGAYFSFNGGQLKPKAITTPKAIAAIPSERLLLETDAPDMLPPETLRACELLDPNTGSTISHPANILPLYQRVAEIRSEPITQLAEQVETNFIRYFGYPADHIEYPA